MREDVLSLRAMGGDPVSEEYLKADLYHRAEALKDIPDTPLFFGRLDYASQHGASQHGASQHGASQHGASQHGASQHGASQAVSGNSENGISGTERTGDDGIAGHSFHIGRRHVHAPDGTPAVIDWRAPVSRPFYRASAADPMNLELRRRFGFSGGELTAYEDELFAGQAGSGTGADRPDRSARRPRTGPSQILINEIERPRSGPMRDIVATIQPDQDDIVRAGADQTVCVQGAPGTGKTAVGLHRVAYLLYAYREQVRRRGVVMVGPNRAFLSYIRDVLPALGELDVTQTTVGELVGGTVAVRGTDDDASAIVKGDARMAEVLRRALWASVRTPAAAVMLPRGSRRWRVAAWELEELVHELRHRGVRYGAARELLEHRIAHVILTQMEAAGEACDDRTHEAVRRSRPVRAAVDAMWPKVDPVRLVFGLLSSAPALAEAAEGVLTAAEQAAIVWSAAPRGPGSARWSAADVVLIDEARDLITRTPSLAHVVVDEAQDLSPMECRALGRRCSTGAATVLGDLAQGTTPWAAPSWESLLANLGKPDTGVRELSVGYRVPRQILDYASSLLAVIAPELKPASSLRADPGALDLTRVPAATLGQALVTACRQASSRPGSVGVIAADPQVPALGRALEAAGLDYGAPGADSGLTLVPVTLAKGLEYDHVVVVEPARIVGAEARGLQRLYVALTRAVSRLTVLYSEPLPEPLPIQWS